MSTPDVLSDLRRRLQGMLAATPPSQSQMISSPWATMIQGHIARSGLKITELKVAIDEIIQLPQYHPLMEIITANDQIQRFCELACMHREEEEALTRLQQQFSQKEMGDPTAEIAQINQVAQSKSNLDQAMQPILDALKMIQSFPSYDTETAIFSAYADSVEGSGGGRSELSKKAQLGDEVLTFLWRYHAKDIAAKGDPSERLAIDIQLTYALLGAFSHVNAIAASFEKIRRIIEGNYDCKHPTSPIDPKKHTLKGADFSPTPRGSGRKKAVQISPDTEAQLKTMVGGVTEEAKGVFNMLELIYVSLVLLDCPANLTAKIGELKMRFFNIQQKFQDPIGYANKGVDIRKSGS